MVDDLLGLQVSVKVYSIQATFGMPVLSNISWAFVI